MSSPTYLFVVNPISGGHDKAPLFRYIDEEVKQKGLGCHIFTTTGKDDESKLAELVEKSRPEVMVAVGGDGTLLLVAKVAKNSPIKIGLMPLGSANGMSRELAIPKIPDIKLSLNQTERFDAAWNIIRKGHVREIDLLEINDQHYSLHLSDIGLNAKIVKRFEAEKIRGYFGYARLLFKELRQKKKVHYQLVADNKTYKGKAYMIVIANATMYGTGAVINPVGKLSDGLFEICLLRQASIITMLRALSSIFKPDLRQRKDLLQIISCRKAQIQLRKPETLQVDGEVIGEVSNVSVRIMPKMLKMITPN
ncbi:MAG: diacylglycerol kinase family lipid kinase [Cyclobacteriaceae bacterium]|nr:diacylglycerol kinase family lipid kinase [Cyclobacteriaceae bacterium]